MPSVIDDQCVKCGACIEVCPMGAIVDGEVQNVINPDVCIDCGACIAECPMGAIKTADEADEKWVEFNKEKSQE